VQLGRKVRDLRLRRGLTVQQLADASDLSKGFISQVENDHTSPSLATLQDLARALETSVAYLVADGEQTPFLVRLQERRRLSPVGATSGLEVLSASPKRNLEVLIAELPAGASANEQRHVRHGEECVLCLEGRVTLTIEDRSLTLETGDSCHFDGRAPHALENVGPTTARVLIAITPAAFEPVTHLGVERAAANGTAGAESLV